MSSTDASSSLRDDLNKLLALQVIDTKIDRAKATLAALDNGSATAAEYNAKKAESESLRDTANKALASQKDAELRLSSIETKAAQVNKTMFSGTVTGSRELENLQKELDMLGRQKDDAELHVLEAMETSTETGAAADTAVAELETIAGRYRKIRAAYKERHAQLSEEITAESAARIEAAKPIPPALLKQYEGIRAKKGGVGAAPLDADGQSCGACHTRLNSTLIGDVMAARTVQTCEYCQRILVPPAVAT